jgi:RES domain-containing protein
MQVWRITTPASPFGAFSGDGARKFGARWNGKGIPVVYTAEHPALAVLEVLVGVEPLTAPPSYDLYRARIPDGLVERLDPSQLPHDWRTYPVPASSVKVGSEWVLSGRSLALLVPSAVLPQANNVLINPRHEAFRDVVVESPERYSFDPRLWKSSPG